MIKSVFFSFGINFVNLLFPLLLIPFYIKTFGIDNYGIIAISLALINYIAVIVDYSWNQTSPIIVGDKKHNPLELSIYISKVTNSKFLLFLFSSIVLLVIVPFYSVIFSELILLLSLFLLLFSRSQNMHYVFIGLDKLKIYFIFNLLCKISTILVFFIFFKTKNQFIYTFFIIAFFDTLQFILSYLFLFVFEKITYKITPIKAILYELKNGFKLFLTNLTICSLLNSSILILGLFSTPQIIGIYSVAEKIIMLCKNCASVLFQGFYPKMCDIGTKNKIQLNNYLNQIFKIYLVLFSIGSAILYFFTDQIIQIFSSSSSNIVEYRVFLVYLIPIPFLASLNITSYFTLILYDKKNILFRIYLIAFVLNIFASLTLCKFYDVYGIIISLILTELYLTISLNYNIVKDEKLNFFKI
jgi:O-antigen/teichoic acid export membrane protein